METKEVEEKVKDLEQAIIELRADRDELLDAMERIVKNQQAIVDLIK